MGSSFEFIEVTFKHWMPNFNECWWDSLIYDLFGCNWLGLVIGTWIITRFGMQKFHWYMEPDAKMMTMSWINKWKYFVTARREYQKKGKWHVFASPKNM